MDPLSNTEVQKQFTVYRQLLQNVNTIEIVMTIEIRADSEGMKLQS